MTSVGPSWAHAWTSRHGIYEGCCSRIGDEDLEEDNKFVTRAPPPPSVQPQFAMRWPDPVRRKGIAQAWNFGLRTACHVRNLVRIDVDVVFAPGSTPNHGTAVDVRSKQGHAHYYSVSLPLQLRYNGTRVLEPGA